MKKRREKAIKSSPLVAVKLAGHFAEQILEQLVTSTRSFPISARVDLQIALNEIFSKQLRAELVGVHRRYGHETLTFSELLATENYAPVIAPLQHLEVDIGEGTPAACLTQGLWLGTADSIRFAVLLSSGMNYGRQTGMHVEVAVPPGEEGALLSRKVLDDLEKLVKRASSYRGKVISLEEADHYGGHGHAGSVRVHKLRKVSRDELILPSKTLQLLERNVSGFIKQRSQLKKLGMPGKKGCSFMARLALGRPIRFTISLASFLTIRRC